ncbi:hypothetical protein ACFQY0_00970 [Haloferula chungangensis]|uniref:Uncharacterized protein n=1 Tax=Haloferula chungangensis TaxID=1048331 RepID=A0ABW2L062_9BACT
MRRVPLPIVFLLCIAVVGTIWWHGTRDYDFLKPPSPTEIEFARQRAAGELAQPSDLFAVETLAEETIAEIPPPEPPPAPPPPTPVIEIGDLSAEPELDAWTDEVDKPAASFVNLASKLEADTQFAWALLAWERVIDHSKPSGEELEAALNGIRRIRATQAPWNDDPKAATELIMNVDAPGDRLKLSMKAANEAADAVEKASSGLLMLSSTVRKGRATAASPKLKVTLTSKEASEPPSVETPSPEDAEDIKKEILRSVFKLVASKLALRDDLQPISLPQSGEEPADSLECRITRLAWMKFAESSASP